MIPKYSERPPLSEIQEMLIKGIVIKVSGPPSSGKTLAINCIVACLDEKGWSIDIVDHASNEILVRMPKLSEEPAVR